jgi:hypothetical protein
LQRDPPKCPAIHAQPPSERHVYSWRTLVRLHSWLKYILTQEALKLFRYVDFGIRCWDRQGHCETLYLLRYRGHHILHFNQYKLYHSVNFFCLS